MAKYTLWEAVNLALSASTKALTEIRQLSMTPPPPGRDGLGFDDLSVEYDGLRTFNFVFQRGDERKQFSFKMPVMIDQGMHRSGRAYDRGDSVTSRGSIWIAQRDTLGTEKPGDDSGAFRLAVKRGHDGKSGKDSGNG